MKNVLVTGATRGLGLAVSARLAKAGYHVIASGRSISAELKALSASELGGGRITFRPYDLSNSAGIRGFVQETVAECGHLYGLVNNAAVGHDGLLATMHESQIDELVQVNLLSAIYLAKYASRSMLLERQGRIVNISSIVAANGFKGLSAYAATKAALLGFGKSLARELGQAGITVNTVSPGYMQTEMSASLDTKSLEKIRRRSALQRLTEPQEVADAVEFLLSEAAAAITGTNLVVDAGGSA